MLCAVFYYLTHRLRRTGGLHDRLVPACVIKRDGHACRFDVFPHIIACIKNHVAPCALYAPCFCAVLILPQKLRLFNAEGHKRHVARKSDVHGGGQHFFPVGHTLKRGRNRLVFKAHILAAYLLIALRAAHDVPFLQKAAVFQRQFHVLLRGHRHLQQRHILFFIAADLEGHVFSIYLCRQHFTSGVDGEWNDLLCAGGVLQLIGRPPPYLSRPGIRTDICIALRACHAFHHIQIVKGHFRQIGVAVVYKGLRHIAPHAAGQKHKRQCRPVQAARVMRKRAQRPIAVAADAQIREPPCAGQAQKPCHAHICHRTENAEIGKIVRQRPGTWVQPAKLPFIGPYG